MTNQDNKYGKKRPKDSKPTANVNEWILDGTDGGKKGVKYRAAPHLKSAFNTFTLHPRFNVTKPKVCEL